MSVERGVHTIYLVDLELLTACIIQVLLGYLVLMKMCVCMEGNLSTSNQM